MNLESLKEQISYIIGRDLARNFAQQGLDLDIEVLAGSMKEGLAGQPSRLTQDQMRNAMEQLQSQMQDQDDQQGDGNDTVNDPNAMNNKQAGEDFLAENKNKPGVTTLPSGLQYEVLTEG